jgi:hypothetical protein
MKAGEEVSQGRDGGMISGLKSIAIEPREDLKHSLLRTDPACAISLPTRAGNRQAMASEAPKRLMIELDQFWVRKFCKPGSQDEATFGDPERKLWGRGATQAPHLRRQSQPEGGQDFGEALRERWVV